MQRVVPEGLFCQNPLQLSPALALQGALPGATGPLSRCLVGEQDIQLGGLSSQPEGGPPAPYTKGVESPTGRGKNCQTHFFSEVKENSINTVGSLNYPHEMFNVFSLEQRKLNKEMFP